MSERFQRCPHCRLPHDIMLSSCPRTGKPLGGRPNTGEITTPGSARAEAAQARVPHVASPPSGSARVSHESAFAPPSAAARTDRIADSPALEGLIGSTLNQRYRVISKLGQGGMGAVFEAEHVGLARMVAVKVLRPEQANRITALKRFQQEARAAGSIGHANICEVYDIGETPTGLPFLVMERLYGESLSARLQREQKLPVAEAVGILCEVLAGLGAAHAKSIVHRDIKPENVFLCDPPRGSRPGTPRISKVVDFGVSKTLALTAPEGEEEMSLTRTGMVMGTPYYMSNEQARGMRDLDARVDIYACGVMLYELLSGKRPFTAPNYNALLLQIIGSTPKPLHELRSDVPAALEDIIERAMQRDREMRFQSAREFREQLRSLPIAGSAEPLARASLFAPQSLAPSARASAPASMRPASPPRVSHAPSAPRRADRPQIQPISQRSPARDSASNSTLPPPAVRREAQRASLRAAAPATQPLLPSPGRTAPAHQAPTHLAPAPLPNFDDAPTFTGTIEFDSPVSGESATTPSAPAMGFDDAPTEVFSPARLREAASRVASARAAAAAAAAGRQPSVPPTDTWDDRTAERGPTRFDK